MCAKMQFFMHDGLKSMEAHSCQVDFQLTLERTNTLFNPFITLLLLCFSFFKGKTFFK